LDKGGVEGGWRVEGRGWTVLQTKVTVAEEAGEGVELFLRNTPLKFWIFFNFWTLPYAARVDWDGEQF